MKSSQRGLSIIELMVGVAVGLFLVAGVTRLFVDFLNDDRRLMLETRVTQELRASADLIVRDVRRAGHWQNALSATTASPRANPYAGIAATGTSLTYQFSRAAEDDAVEGNESFGFRLVSGKLQALDGKTSGGADNWTDLTDPAIVLIESFSIDASNSLDVSLGHHCPTACDATSPTCPKLQVRQYTIVLTGRSTRDASVVRSVRAGVRVRNDSVSGDRCPSLVS